MATIAIGDIHGNLAALTDLLDQLLPDAVEGDVIVFLGDYVDRGPDAKGCIDAILAFEDRDNAELAAGGWPMPRIVGRTVGIDTISHGV